MDKEKIVPMSMIYVYITWPIAGILLIIYFIIGYIINGVRTAILSFLVGMLILLYGSWALIRAYKRLR